MTTRTEFQRARSPEAKRQRERAILDAAGDLALRRSVREVTLTDIAEAVGMHKSAMLRYFETREQIFLSLTAEQYQEWSAEVREDLVRLEGAAPSAVAELLTATLLARPLFCDLLAQAPLNLERNVSFDAVREFKLVAIAATRAVADEMQRLFALGSTEAVEVVAVATSMAGALWQMAAPRSGLQEFYRSDPQLAHAIVDVPPRLTSVLTALITGYASRES
ncbi:TetR family transcriptional regulator [Streptomyces nodosus]